MQVPQHLSGVASLLLAAVPVVVVAGALYGQLVARVAGL